MLFGSWRFATRSSRNPNYPYMNFVGQPDPVDPNIPDLTAGVLKHYPRFKWQFWEGRWVYDWETAAAAPDVTYQPDQSASGQNNTNPPGIFHDHVIINIGGTYYDPSYGVKYGTTLLDVQKKAIAGFYIVQEVAPDLTKPNVKVRAMLIRKVVDPTKVEIVEERYIPPN
jgi:hypothetical protein